MTDPDTFETLPRKIEKTVPLCPECREIAYARVSGDNHQTTIDAQSDALTTCYHRETDTLWIHLSDQFLRAVYDYAGVEK